MSVRDRPSQMATRDIWASRSGRRVGCDPARLLVLMETTADDRERVPSLHGEDDRGDSGQRGEQAGTRSKAGAHRNHRVDARQGIVGMLSTLWRPGRAILNALARYSLAVEADISASRQICPKEDRRRKQVPVLVERRKATRL